jgi:hypothetical protein
VEQFQSTWAPLLYLVAGVLFILALRGLSSPATSQKGNRNGMIGMTIAVATTIVLLWDQLDPTTWALMIGAVAIGGTVGAYIARKIPMTDMPQLVAAFHSLVGLAAVLVAAAALYAPDSFGIMGIEGVKTASLIELGLGSAIGALTFTGSIIAFAKLNGNMSGKPIMLPFRHFINAGLAVFLVLVTIYITIRYEKYMAIAALAALGFDLITTAGVYSLVGFEVTPATVIGLLTILGFSLYDTVIVFDKVEENTKGFEHTTRRTFAEQANLAINQTFMRSINTSLISVMPVLSLIVVAVWVLGVGTLKDLALVQLVGILVGTYSSIFFATPLLVTMRERTELVRAHTRRVLARRNRLAAPNGVTGDSGELTTAVVGAAAAVAVGGSAAGTKPAPGARPIRPRRPSGKRER